MRWSVLLLVMLSSTHAEISTTDPRLTFSIDDLKFGTTDTNGRFSVDAI